MVAARGQVIPAFLGRARVRQHAPLVRAYGWVEDVLEREDEALLLGIDDLIPA